MKNKKDNSITIGELIDFLLEREFDRNDKVVIKTLHTEKPCFDAGVSMVNGEDRKLIISMRKIKVMKNDV